MISMSSSSKNQSESGSSSGGGLTYKDAGVDIDAGSELVRRIAKIALGIGGFGGLFPLGDSYLVSGTDGVRTKLKLAFETGITAGKWGYGGVFLNTQIDYKVINIDQWMGFYQFCNEVIQRHADTCTLFGLLFLEMEVSREQTGLSMNVYWGFWIRKQFVTHRVEFLPAAEKVVMSVNDIVTSGAKPLFFLDYFATSRLDVDLAEKVIKGIVDCCQQSDCALLGGETAEMPNFYADGEYDLSGFAVGIVKRDSVIVGEVLVGLPSNPLCSNLICSNLISLLMRIFIGFWFKVANQLPGETVTLGEALMAPTVIYVKQVLDIISKGGMKGIAHVTGGGFTDNIPRVFPKGLGALIYKDSWVIPPVFKWIQEAGRIEDAEMRRTFNMGIGMVLVVSQEAAHRILGDAKGAHTAYRIGEVVSGDGVSYQ
ncbi:hypothetical protein ACSBR1_027958 [Camellia fascicularis]